MINLVSNSVEDTLAIGRAIGSVLSSGDVVGLVGPLGAGKTHLVKGLAAGLGVSDARQVNSPTFVIVNEYEARGGGGEGGGDRGGLRIFHIDAYRLRGGEDLAALGFEEMVERGAVVIEWADKVLDLMPEDAVVIEMEPTGPSERRLTSQVGVSGRSLVEALREARRELEAARERR